MILVRFKRFKQDHVFLTQGKNDAWPWGLSTQLAAARSFSTPQEALTEIEVIGSIIMPKVPLEFDERHLFIMQLYGRSWDDQVDGMVIDMDDTVKAQLLTDQLEVVETHRMRNQIWSKHYT